MSSLPRRIAPATVLALVLSACVANAGASAPFGFSEAFTPPVMDGGAPPLLLSVEGTGAGSAWAVGEGGTTLRQAGDTFHVVAPSGSTVTLAGLSTLDVNHAFAIDANGADVLAWTSAGWSTLGVTPPARTAASAATWASATNDVWLAGDGIEHWDGTTWTQAVPSGTSFSGLSGSFDTDVWAVGAGVQHWNGRSWTPVAIPSGTPKLSAAWSSGLFDTWIVGAQGTVLHWNGTSLARLTTSGTTKDLTSISGSSSADVWIGGQDGLLLQWDGMSWSEHLTPTALTIRDVWTTTGSPVLFVDGTGVVQRYVFQ